MRKIIKKIVLKIYALQQKLLGRFQLGRIPIVRKMRQIILGNVHPKIEKAYGMTFYMDNEFGFHNAQGYKPAVGAILESELEDGDVAVDIGANIGLFTCVMAKGVGASGRVYAFEPDPRNRELLAKNISINEVADVVVVSDNAISNEENSFSLYSRGAHSTFGFDHVGNEEDAITVRTISLDEFFKDKEVPVSLLKTDTIGAEVKILRGARSLIANNDIKWISGFCPAYLDESGDGARAYLEELTDVGFAIYDISDGEKVLVGVDEFDKFIRKYSPNNGVAQAEIYCKKQQ